jgi:hypothetical protein
MEKNTYQSVERNSFRKSFEESIVISIFNGVERDDDTIIDQLELFNV